MSCETGERNKTEIDSLYTLLEKRNTEINSRLYNLEIGQVNIENSLANMSVSLEKYMEEGQKYRRQVEKNSMVRNIFTAIVCFAGGIGVISGAIWTVQRIINI